VKLKKKKMKKKIKEENETTALNREIPIKETTTTEETNATYFCINNKIL